MVSLVKKIVNYIKDLVFCSQVYFIEDQEVVGIVPWVFVIVALTAIASKILVVIYGKAEI